MNGKYAHHLHHTGHVAFVEKYTSIETQQYLAYTTHNKQHQTLLHNKTYEMSQRMSQNNDHDIEDSIVDIIEDEIDVEGDIEDEIVWMAWSFQASFMYNSVL
jgi:hypothetical protein